MNSEGTAFESAQAGTPIASMEGVFVKATGSGQTAVFTTTLQRSSAQMNIRLSYGQNYVDNAIIGFGEGSTLLKAMFNPNASKVYFAEDKGDYSIIRVGKSGEQALNFKASENGSYTLSFNLDEVELSYLHLIDNLTGADVDLLALRQAQRPVEYTFDARTTDYACRFKLVFNANMTTGADNFAFFNGSEWIVSNMGEATLQVVDMLGRILVNETINGNASIRISETPGVYVMRLVNGNEVRAQKIVVQ